MKYVIIKAHCPMLGMNKFFPILFHENLTHSNIADVMRQAVRQELGKVCNTATLHSAGMFYAEGCQAAPGSVSCNIQPADWTTTQGRSDAAMIDNHHACVEYI